MKLLQFQLNVTVFRKKLQFILRSAISMAYDKVKGPLFDRYTRLFMMDNEIIIIFMLFYEFSSSTAKTIYNESR